MSFGWFISIVNDSVRECGEFDPLGRVCGGDVTKLISFRSNIIWTRFFAVVDPSVGLRFKADFGVFGAVFSRVGSMGALGGWGGISEFGRCCGEEDSSVVMSEWRGFGIEITTFEREIGNEI